MNLKPLDDRIVVKPSEAVQTTASGLVIPDTAKEKPQQGTVLAVGPGRWSDDEGKHFALDIKVGDVVLYSKYGNRSHPWWRRPSYSHQPRRTRSCCLIF